jgi:hypothetical protein
MDDWRDYITDRKRSRGHSKNLLGANLYKT